jgi:hypothetical protein
MKIATEFINNLQLRNLAGYNNESIWIHFYGNKWKNDIHYEGKILNVKFEEFDLIRHKEKIIDRFF